MGHVSGAERSIIRYDKRQSISGESRRSPRLRLITGSPAPQFVGHDVTGAPIELAHYRGQPVLLSFFRTAQCPLCNLRVWYYQSQSVKWAELGLHVITVFDSSADQTMDFCSGFASTFPLIADPQGGLFRKYHVPSSPLGAFLGLGREILQIGESRRLRLPIFPYVGPRMFRMPADFLIARDASIALSHYGRDAGDHIGLDLVEQFARDQQKPLTPTLPRQRPARTSLPE